MRFLNKTSIKRRQKHSSPMSPAIPNQQHIPIWFEFKSGQCVDINSQVIIDDTTGLIQFLRYQGQRLIAKQIKAIHVQPKISYPAIIFYEKDYQRW